MGQERCTIETSLSKDEILTILDRITSPHPVHMFPAIPGDPNYFSFLFERFKDRSHILVRRISLFRRFFPKVRVEISEVSQGSVVYLAYHSSPLRRAIIGSLLLSIMPANILYPAIGEWISHPVLAFAVMYLLCVLVLITIITLRARFRMRADCRLLRSILKRENVDGDRWIARVFLKERPFRMG